MPRLYTDDGDGTLDQASSPAAVTGLVKPYTMACVFKLNSNPGTTGVAMSPWSINLDNVSFVEWAPVIYHIGADANKVYVHNSTGSSLTGSTLTTFTITTSDNWVLLVIAGPYNSDDSVDVYKITLADGGYTKETVDTTGITYNADMSGAYSISIGKSGHANDNAFALDGDIWLCAAWGRQLSDDEVKNLAHGLAPWYASDPAVLYILDHEPGATLSSPNHMGTGSRLDTNNSFSGSSFSASAPFGYGLWESFWSLDVAAAVAAATRRGQPVIMSPGGVAFG